MVGLTDFITERRWEDVFTLWYVLVDDAYKVLEHCLGSWRRRGTPPVFSDSEVITVAMIADTWFAGDEAKSLSFLRQYHRGMFPHLLSVSQFNERRRTLTLVIEQIRRYLLVHFHLIAPDDRQRLLDSVPIPICGYGRTARNQTAAGPDFIGWIACKKAPFFGFRMQMTVTPEQVIDQWQLNPAGYKDGKVMFGLLSETADVEVFADNAYHDPWFGPLLRERHHVTVWAVQRKDAHEPWPEAFLQTVRRCRLRIETAFSVLTTCFNIQHPGSRSLSGLCARIASRILAYTLCFISAPLLLELRD
jgi:Transposase DDE domain